MRVSAERDDLLDEGRGSEAEFFACHDEDGFNAGKLAIRQRDAKLIIEIGEVAQTARIAAALAAFCTRLTVSPS